MNDCMVATLHLLGRSQHHARHLIPSSIIPHSSFLAPHSPFLPHSSYVTFHHDTLLGRSLMHVFSYHTSIHRLRPVYVSIRELSLVTKPSATTTLKLTGWALATVTREPHCYASAYGRWHSTLSGQPSLYRTGMSMLQTFFLHRNCHQRWTRFHA